jgi:hypothetical protein
MLLLLILCLPGIAQKKLSVEFGSGLPYNISMPLSIRQSGYTEIKLTAAYNSEPFKIPIYWIWRIGFWSDNSGWELEAIHHKIFLDNKPDEVEYFSISHGINYITINRCWDTENYILRTGAGIVLDHPESKIRGKQLKENGGILKWGYYISGPAINLTVAKRFYVLESLYLDIEAKLNASYSNVPINGGNADVYNIVLQFDLLPGWDFNL